MLHEVEESAKAGLDFFHRSLELQSPQAIDRAFEHLIKLEQVGYTDIAEVQHFRDEVEQAWAFVDTIEEAWAAKEDAPKLCTYPAGSWGPEEAEARIPAGRRHGA